MKDYLFKIHTNLKEAWCNLIAYEVVSRGGEVVINYEHPLIDYEYQYVRDVETISKIKVIDGQCCAYISSSNVLTDDPPYEEWFDIRNLSMNELYEIADRL